MHFPGNSYNELITQHCSETHIRDCIHSEGPVLDVLAGAAAIDLEAEVHILLVLCQVCVQAHSRISAQPCLFSSLVQDLI